MSRSFHTTLLGVLCVLATSSTFACSCSGGGDLTYAEYLNNQYVFIGQVVDVKYNTSKKHGYVTSGVMKFKPYKSYKEVTTEDNHIYITSQSSMSSSCGRLAGVGRWMFVFSSGWIGGCSRKGYIDIDTNSELSVEQQVDEYIANSHWHFLLTQMMEIESTSYTVADSLAGNMVRGKKNGVWFEMVKNIRDNEGDKETWRRRNKSYFVNGTLDSIYRYRDPRNSASKPTATKYDYFSLGHWETLYIDGKKRKRFRYSKSEELIEELNYNADEFKILRRIKMNEFWQYTAYYYSSNGLKKSYFKDTKASYWDPDLYKGWVSGRDLKDQEGKILEYQNFSEGGILTSKTVIEGSSRKYFSYYPTGEGIQEIHSESPLTEGYSTIKRFRKNGDLFLEGVGIREIEKRYEGSTFYLKNYTNSKGIQVVENGNGHLVEWHNDTLKSIDVKVKNGIFYDRFRLWDTLGQLEKDGEFRYSRTHSFTKQLLDHPELNLDIVRIGKPIGTHYDWWPHGSLSTVKKYFANSDSVHYDNYDYETGELTNEYSTKFEYARSTGKIRIHVRGENYSSNLDSSLRASLYEDGNITSRVALKYPGYFEFIQVMHGVYSIEISLPDGDEVVLENIQVGLGMVIDYGFDVDTKKMFKYEESN